MEKLRWAGSTGCDTASPRGARRARELYNSLLRAQRVTISDTKLEVPVTQSRSGTVVVFAKGFSPDPGGIETYSEQVTRAYLRSGLDVLVLTQTSDESGWSTRACPDGRFRLFNAGPGVQVRVFLRWVVEARLLKSEADVVGVHSTTWRSGIVAQLLFGSTPRVVTVHGREILNCPPGTRSLMRRVFRKASLVLAVSEETCAVARRVVTPRAEARWTVAHNGLTDVAHAHQSERTPHTGPVRFLALCRLVPRKNISRAVDAVATLDPGIRQMIDFRIAGRGPEATHIRRAIDAGGLGDVVTMLGYVAEDDVPELYNWADVFIHPQSHVGEGDDFEGFGIAIADAMGYGCAVIAGRDGGPRDFVRHDETGFVVDGNSTESIAAAITRVVSDTELRHRVASAGRTYALTSFSWDGHIQPALQVMGLRPETST